jgi:hypothetical protein
LTTITIPKNVTSIGQNAFKGCTDLIEVTIPNSFQTYSHALRIGIESIYPYGVYPQPEPRRAIATAVLSNGFVVGARITNGGARYTEVPSVRIIGGDGSGAEGVAILDNWWVTGIEITNAGKGYTSAPTIIIDPPLGVPTTQINLRLVPAITVTGEIGQTGTIEVADTADGPWTEWRTVVIGLDGTTEIDLDEDAKKRFYRVRN